MSVDTADESIMVGIDINGTSRTLLAGKLYGTASQASGTFTNMGAFTEMGVTSSLTWDAALFDWNSVDADLSWDDLPPGAGDVVMSDILVFSTHPDARRLPGVPGRRPRAGLRGLHRVHQRRLDLRQGHLQDQNRRAGE
jgi:hypothetical protein